MRFYKVIFVPSRWRKLAIHVLAVGAGAGVVAAGNALTDAIGLIGIDPVYALALGAVVADVVRQLTLEIATYDPQDWNGPGPQPGLPEA